MRIRPAGLTNLYRFPTGRRLHALREIARRAMDLVIAPVVTHTTRAIAHDGRVMAMEAAMAAANTSQHGPDAAVLDRRVDRAVTGLELHLDAQVRMYGEDHPIGRDATLVRDELLPDGAGAITFLPYANQGRIRNVPASTRFASFTSRDPLGPRRLRGGSRPGAWAQ